MSRTLVPNSQPTLADILHEAIRGRLALVHTQIIGVVEAYDHTAQKATVRPVVQFRRVDDDTGEVETYTPPAIANVPVAFPSATGYAITFPLTVGDTGEIRFMERSIDEWLDQGGTGVTAQDPRRFDLSDAVFYPGTRSFANAIAASGIDASALVLEFPAAKLGSSAASEAAMLGDTFEGNLFTYIDGMETFVTGLKTVASFAQLNLLALSLEPKVQAFKAQVVGGTHRSAKLELE